MTRRLSHTVAVIFALLVLTSSSFVGATPARMEGRSPFVSAPAGQETPAGRSSAPSFAPGRLIVQFRPGVQPALEPAGLPWTGRPALDAILSGQQVLGAAPLFAEVPDGGHPDPRGLARTYLLQLPADGDVAAAVAALSASPDVAWAEPDYLAHAVDTVPSDPLFADQWGLAQIQAPAAWDVVTGTPAVVIAVADSGLDLIHPDLAAQLWMNPGEIPGNGLDDDNNGLVDDVYGWDFVSEVNDPSDDNGHGTQVAGVAGATTDNGLGVAGVCWNCRLMAVKVMQGGIANYSDIAQGVLYAAQKGAKVINLSLGGYSDSSALRAAIEAAVEDYGAVVVAGAGNDNSSTPFYPAAYPEVLAVAGTDSGDVKWSGSNYGTWVDVTAPAVAITTTYMGGDYGPADGTSFSTPFVAGLAGLVRSQHPLWSPALVRAQVLRTADPLDTLNPGYAGLLGSGRVNAAAAVSQAPHPILEIAATAVNGDPLGRPVPGERATLQVTLGNGWLDAAGVVGELATADPFVTVVTGTVGFGDIPAGGTGTGSPLFAFDVAGGAGYNHPIPFTLAVSANSGAYSATLALTVTTRSAEEPVGGTIFTNTVWTNDKTYIVQSNIGIMPGVTLTIEPGTEVLFNADTNLNVGGTLVADGTEEQPIRFLPHQPGGSWGRIYFDDTSVDATATVSGTYQGGNLLRWVEAEGAGQGIGCNGATPFLEQVTTDGGGIDCTVGNTPFWLRGSDLTGDVSVNPGTAFSSGSSPLFLTTTLPHQGAWARTYGGSDFEWGNSLYPTSDGGYVVLADTYSFGAGGEDCWVLKLDGAGNVLWQKTYGGSGAEQPSSIYPTGDGGYVVAGSTGSFGAGYTDIWVLKLDGQGNVLWQKTYGGSGAEQPSSIYPTGDGGYVVAGSTGSFGAGYADAWVLKLDGQGNVLWQKTYGGSSDGDVAYSIIPTGDGGYVAAGTTGSFGAGGYDFWVLKLDGAGNVTWQKTYGGSGFEYARSIYPTGDGGYVVAGYTESFGAGGWDAWILKLDGLGNVLWQKTYGGNSSDWVFSLHPTGDGGYVVAGFTGSFGPGNGDAWVLKLDQAGNVVWQRTYGASGEDAAVSIYPMADSGYVVAGTTASFGAGYYDVWVLKLDDQGDIPCSCSIIDSSSAIVIDTSASVTATLVTGSDTSITPAVSPGMVVDTLASEAVQCVGSEAPVALDDNYTLTEDIGLIVPAPGILGNDSDPDGDPLAATWVSGPSQGSLTLGANGAFTYTPGTDQIGLDAFTYAVGDGYGCDDTAAVTLTIVNAPLTYHFWRTTVYGSLTLPKEAEVLTCTVAGDIGLGNEGLVRATTVEGSITISDTGKVLSNTIRGGGIVAGDGSLVQGNNVEGGAGWGIAASGAVTVTRNRIVGNASGIQVGGGLVQGNLIANNSGTGLEISGNTTMVSNTLTGNAGSAIQIVAATAVTLTGNNLEFNSGPYDVENLVPHATMAAIPAQGNWWGTTDPAVINQRIYDFLDDYTLGQVVYTLAATGPVQTAPAYVRQVTVDPNPVGIETATFVITLSRPMDTNRSPELGFSAWRTYAVSNSALPHHCVSGVAVEQDGTLWFGTCGGGAARFDGTTWITYTASNSGLVNNDIRTVLIDSNGNKWFGTWGGVARFDDAMWVTYTTATSGLANNDVHAVLVDTDGTAWFGTWGGGVSVRRTDGSWHTYDTSNSGLGDDRVAAALLDSGGNRWFGTWGGGVSVLHADESWQTYNTSNSGLADDTISAAALDATGNLWLGTWGGVSVLDVDGSWQTYDPFNSGLSDARVLAIALNPAGDRWFGTYEGGASAQRADGVWQTYMTSNSGLADNIVRAIALDSGGGVWLGTNGGVSAFSEYRPEVNPEWSATDVYLTVYDVTTLVPRANYTITVGEASGTDGIEIAPNSAHTFTVDYAGEIGDTTPPSQPAVRACAGESPDIVSAQWYAHDPDSEITLYRYSIGSVPGGGDVINWTTTPATSFQRTGLGLVPGQTYYVAVQARNEGGLWSEPGIPPGIVAGSGECTVNLFRVYLPLVLRRQ